jgi:protein required for attachment to host cells
MSGTWILVADQARARIFHGQGNSRLHEVETLLNPDARINEQEIVSDRPGRAFDSAGSGRHSMGSPVDPKEEEAIRFAKQVTDRLERGRQEGAFERLVLVAAPHFLGLLRKDLHTPLASMVSHELNKDLTRLTERELRSHLPAEI